MALKSKQTGKDKITISARFPKYAGYLDSALFTPVSLQVANSLSETAEVKVTLKDSEGLLIPYETRLQVPFESTVEINADAVFSPLYLASCDELKTVEAVAEVSSPEGELFCKKTGNITVLPFDYWEGIEGNCERLSGYIRPRIADCARILEDAGARLKKWSASIEFYGYTGADKNAVRQIFAAVFAAIKGMNIEKTCECDLSAPVSAFQENLLSERKASPLQLALFAAACLEAARLHPVVAVGKNAVGVGVWLYDSCFLDTVTDDAGIVEKYLSDGINNLGFFDIEDVFAGKTAAYSLSETHFCQKLKENYYEEFVDVRRCRMAGIGALAMRGKGIKGFELIKESEMSDDKAPEPLKQLKKVSLDEAPQKNRQWERRLLDLTFKNTLLNFTGKNALHLHCFDADELYARLFETGGMRLKASGEDVEKFGAQLSAPALDLNRLELKKGLLRAFENAETLSETARLLQRKNREADEETGAKILYLAFGFLKYIGKEDAKPKYAPLVLLPVTLKRAKGNEDYAIEGAEREFSVNSTLLEYLKQEYNIDVRGLGSGVGALKISEILAMVLCEIANMKGWSVEKDVYLATFSFQRYLMWNDIHTHFDKLKKNATVSALFEGKAERLEPADVQEEDEGDPRGTLIALPADSSQYSAIALSRAGRSFVLHGPPGTGKSQTITNIIANALEDRKRVLFVAEKKAALDVVKKRLDAIGIGEFCLELHSNKTDKADVLSRMEKTLALAKLPPVDEFEGEAREIAQLREELKKPMLALHKKRRLGISIYQAILLYLKNKDAPDVLDIESAFYDSLDEKKLSECKSRILSAAAAAKECGGVYSSPFDNVYVSEYSTALRDRVFCASEVIIAEIKHLKAFLALFLEFYRQKMSAITQGKLENLCKIAKNLSSGVYDKYFSSVTEEQLYVFYNANRRLDERLGYYYRHFKTLVDLDKEYEQVKTVLKNGDGFRKSKGATIIFKRLSRAALHPIAEEDAENYLKTLVEIHEAMESIKSVPLSKNFQDRGGDIVFKRRTEFLRDLYDLHDLCAKTFLDYNADAFNGMCLRAQNGYTMPVLEGYLKAAEAFFGAQNRFLEVTEGKASKIRQEDILEYYSVKAGALLDNVDMLPNWCMYRKTGLKLKELGCNFVTEALESGKLTGENILAGFEKNVYKNFLEINIPLDPDLSRLTVGTLEETVEKFRIAWEEFSVSTRKKIRADLIARLPSEDGADSAGVELSAFKRLAKSNLRGSGLRAMFAEIPTLLSRVSPCMLMSPTTVAQYIQPENDIFDLVIFDEASQMTTAEAIGSLARAKAAIVVGDPRQLPPTSFFHSSYVDEENLENEDLESILDDCLALGMPERHLKWHYRSKHESLIAFSNSMYYDSRLCTFPSPDAMESKVSFVLVDGVYDRGFTKRNRKESEALVKEVVRRLKDPVLSKSSMGIVTFSSAQQSDIEKLLSKEISSKKLEAVAYEREEPIFVKNLENVQGDERDVILFSVCYGPDATGRISLNFGPLNQTGGWRRLNVALSRAREEMVVFSSMTYGMIDLSKTTSKGVAGLKKFLEFAEKGRTTLSVRSEESAEEKGIGAYLAEEIKNFGYDCRTNVGASDFKIDVAVIDPKNGRDFILAVICDGTEKFSIKDRNILQIQTLKRANWNVMRVNCVNFYNNPKREVKRIKDCLDKLTGTEKKGAGFMTKYSKPYKSVKATGAQVASFITGGDNDAEIMARLKEIVTVEEPISREFLRTRCLETFGIQKSGARIEAKLDLLIDACAFLKERVMGRDYFMKKGGAMLIGKFRIEKEPVLRKTDADITPFEVVSLTKAILEERVSLYLEELTSLVAGIFKVRQSEQLSVFVRDCVFYGEERGFFVRSVSDRISLA